MSQKIQAKTQTQSHQMNLKQMAEQIILILHLHLVSRALMDGIMECVTGMARTLNCLKWTQKTTDTTTMASQSLSQILEMVEMQRTNG